MNILEIYCSKNMKNKSFIENGVDLILSDDQHLYSKKDLEEKRKDLSIALATDFSKKDVNLCEECGAPIVCYKVTSYEELYSCVGNEQHCFNIN